MKKKLRQLYFSKTFMFYLASYTLAICIPIISLSVFAYYMARDILTNEVDRTFSNLAHLASSAIEQKIQEYKNLIITMGLDNEVLVFSESALNRQKQSVELTNALNIVASQNRDFLVSSRCYLRKYDALYQSMGIPLYGKEIKDDRQWINNTLESPETLHIESRIVSDISTVKNDVVTLSMAFPFGFNENAGVLAVDISQQKLFQLINEIKGNDSADIFLLNKDGQILISKQPASSRKNAEASFTEQVFSVQDHGMVKLDGSYAYVSHMKNYPVATVILLPRAYITDRLDILLNTTIVVFFILLIIGWLIAIMLSKKMYTPIKELADQFEQDEQKHHPDNLAKSDTLKYIKSKTQWILRDNQRLDELFSSNISKLQENFIYNLMTNSISSIADIQTEIRDLSINFPHEGFCVLIYEIDNYTLLRNNLKEVGLSLYKTSVKHVLVQLFSSRFQTYLSEMDESHFALLINLPVDNDSQESFFNYISNSKQLIGGLFEENTRISVSIGVGSLQLMLEKTYVSFYEAKDALQYKISHNSIVHHKDIIEQENQNFLGYNRIVEYTINNLKSGDVTEMNHQLDKLHEEIEKAKFLPFSKVQMIYARILDEGLEVCVERNVDFFSSSSGDFSLYKNLLNFSSLNDIHHFVRNFLSSVCTSLADQQSESHYVSEAVKFIDRNFKSNIGLVEVADDQGISPAYLSRLFKNELGINLLTYLNKKRVNVSKEFLLNTSMTISNIAQNVGYNNIQSYIKFFKKYTGVTPSEYRKGNS